MRKQMKTILRLVGVLLAISIIETAAAQDAEPLDRFLGAEPETFQTEAAALEALKVKLTAQDKPGLAKLLGLNLEEVGQTEDFDQRVEKLATAATERIALEEDGPDRRTVVLGREVWPFPFPIVRIDDAWTFDTMAGLEEAVIRRIGENELETISNLRAYIGAQEDYASEDRDGDGVLEFAQQIKSDAGKQNGLYWPAEEFGGEESPVASFIIEAKALGPSTEKTGYFGYRYKILKGQGNNIAGGRYDYVINGNMIAGFALVAWPADYGVSGVKTFLVSHHGSIYEKDLGETTAQVASKITRFDPDDSWSLLGESSDEEQEASAP
jgi:hypothetical protein